MRNYLSVVLSLGLTTSAFANDYKIFTDEHHVN
jgi:hypothetical protein